LDVDVGDYGGSLLNASVGVNYQVVRHVGIGLNYNHFDLDITVDKSDWRGRVRSTYNGWYANISIYW
jgi:hypothetical protein